ncbi:hypothetical protein EJJ34_14435 [Bacillus subtilis subsp. subtilis NCIB 3610 = ATCC 6051 = DSM 10]|nr:hypothetical protein EJJ34_14435 [Bacillus subtilis subsp. subtilis NCIB 3610 = ATCC 6051 = DSM 10]
MNNSKLGLHAACFPMKQRKRIIQKDRRKLLKYFNAKFTAEERAMESLFCEKASQSSSNVLLND